MCACAVVNAAEWLNDPGVDALPDQRRSTLDEAQRAAILGGFLWDPRLPAEYLLLPRRHDVCQIRSRQYSSSGGFAEEHARHEHEPDIPSHRDEVIAGDSSPATWPCESAALVQRPLACLVAFVGVSILIFGIARVIPGDPVRITLGPTATDDQILQFR
jgi:hypothetical protein